ncbi:hypothetical protein E1B28_012633 [Marasmius oreades]|uniref:Uncharacterized protein n=1 Tax=Marasmius oreades TaxID=181124 RepID=A0A9P7RRV9_9AGAR|nr:uncharacterized protein E1B28_012633 [Marasmius oreades]KAG7088661.1 hypothetical protein E1B28_012633 [Marasmius oreades]
MEHELLRPLVHGVSEESLSSLIIKLGKTSAYGPGLPKSAEELNDLPEEKELKPGSDEEARMGVCKMRVPSSELLEKMKPIAISEIWNEHWITLALAEVKILKETQSGSFGREAQLAYTNHIILRKQCQRGCQGFGSTQNTASPGNNRYVVAV